MHNQNILHLRFNARIFRDIYLYIYIYRSSIVLFSRFIFSFSVQGNFNILTSYDMLQETEKTLVQVATARGAFRRYVQSRWCCCSIEDRFYPLKNFLFIYHFNNTRCIRFDLNKVQKIGKNQYTNIHLFILTQKVFETRC